GRHEIGPEGKPRFNTAQHCFKRVSGSTGAQARGSRFAGVENQALRRARFTLFAITPLKVARHPASRLPGVRAAFYRRITTTHPVGENNSPIHWRTAGYLSI
ncbi:MAG TPA: hypothetical protein VNJ04_05870, partial [Gemmatimonadaceae bacterium]|nr:hypothetical protein [Gemmatimonadaceae bacterium]